jgi:tyrosyl-tRNA synthetase
MSKSLGNYIPVMTTPDDKFGKFMSIPDGQILPYALAFADIHADETEGLRAWIADHPLEAKKRLGTLFVACEEGRLEAGEAARETFERRFSQRTITDEDCVALPAGTANLSDALFAAGSFASRSELRRLFEQNAVRWLNPDGSDGQVAKPDDALRAGSRLRVGKQKRFRCP